MHKTIAVFGATGGIGRHVVNAALEKGWEVRAYVRNPAKLAIDNPSLTVIEGQVDEYGKIRSCIDGCDAVVVALGISMRPGANDRSSAIAHGNILRAMAECDVRRLVDWSTPSIPSAEDVRSLATVAPGILAGVFLPDAKRALMEVADVVRASDSDWTLVRFMAPNDKPAIPEVKVGFGERPLSFAIPRESIARFMVEQVESDEYMHRMPIIGS